MFSPLLRRNFTTSQRFLRRTAKRQPFPFKLQTASFHYNTAPKKSVFRVSQRSPFISSRLKYFNRQQRGFCAQLQPPSQAPAVRKQNVLAQEPNMNPEEEEYTTKDRIYDFIHHRVVDVLVAGTILLFFIAGFLSVKIHKQNKRVRAQMKQVKYFRDVMKACPEIFEDVDPDSMDVTPIYAYFCTLADENDKVKISALLEDELIETLVENSVPLKQIVDWADSKEIPLEALVYIFTITKYFSLFEKRDETKKIKRQIGDKMYKMMRSYSRNVYKDGKVRMLQVQRWSEAAFGLALCAAPDLGHMTLEEYLPLFVKGMLDNEGMEVDTIISRRNFDLVHKASDYHIGVRREKRKGNPEVR